jgi:hypothetical protein
MPADTEALRHLAGYLDLLTRDTAVMSPGLSGIVTTHMQDLVALASGPGGMRRKSQMAAGCVPRACGQSGPTSCVTWVPARCVPLPSPSATASRRAIFKSCSRARAPHCRGLCCGSASPASTACSPIPAMRAQASALWPTVRASAILDLQPRIPALLWRDSLGRAVCCATGLQLAWMRGEAGSAARRE